MHSHSLYEHLVDKCRHHSAGTARPGMTSNRAVQIAAATGIRDPRRRFRQTRQHTRLAPAPAKIRPRLGRHHHTGISAIEILRAGTVLGPLAGVIHINRTLAGSLHDQKMVEIPEHDKRIARCIEVVPDCASTLSPQVRSRSPLTNDFEKFRSIPRNTAFAAQCGGRPPRVPNNRAQSQATPHRTPPPPSAVPSGCVTRPVFTDTLRKAFSAAPEGDRSQGLVCSIVRARQHI